MIRLVVVDDDAPTRVQTTTNLTAGGLLSVVAEASTSDEALRVCEKLLPDIVLLDLHLPGLLSSIDLIKRLVALRNVKVIAFASLSKASEIQDILEAGAHGYVLKDDAPALIRMAILMVSRGSRNITSPSLPRHLMRLTPQERNILKEITKRGKLAKAAERMMISEAALMETVAQLAQKLEIEDSGKLIKWAKKHGF